MTRLLLDTHVFLWWRQDHPSLRPATVTAIRDAEAVYVSMASAWEVAIKVALGRLRLSGTFADGVTDSHFDPLAIAFAHIEEVARLPHLHRDPFDRMLIAQARVEGLTLVSRDEAMAGYDVAWMVA